MRHAIFTAAILAVAFAGALMPFAPGRAEEVAVTVPPLTGEALTGANLFTRYCARCHGAAAGGTDKGPPLIHRIYEPNHHADGAFYMAALRGVRAHHWRFGDMPPVEGITEEEIARIIAFVRTVQKANGIF